tara:strand:- start:227 stop:1315 length:1089 start_codon:yes stop_codon:yes gene_type:complete
MADFTGNKIKDTYARVVQYHNGTLKDGLGFAISASAGSLSGSLSGSFEGNFNGSFTGSISGSIVGPTSSSLASRITTNATNISTLDATVSDLNTATASLASTGSNTFSSNQIISGTLDSNAKGNKIRFHYDNLAALPSATTYHGMFAHVHAEGASYYAHAGNWVKLIDSNGTGSLISNSDTSSFAVLAENNTFEGTSTFEDSLIISASTTFTGSAIDSKNGNTIFQQYNNRVQFRALGSSSNNLGNISVERLANSSSLGLLYADTIQIGAFNGDSITVGNVSSSLILRSNTFVNSGSIEVIGNVTASNLTTNTHIISASQVLTLQPSNPAPPLSDTGSLITSGSPAQLYIYNGSGSTGWNRV